MLSTLSWIHGYVGSIQVVTIRSIPLMFDHETIRVTHGHVGHLLHGYVGSTWIDMLGQRGSSPVTWICWVNVVAGIHGHVG